MNRLAAVFMVTILALFASAPAYAQATRTWVSGVGDDANPCSRTAPCATYAGAISKTAAGGEISALDPGGFGAVTITKAMTINGDGDLASTTFSRTNAVNVVENCSISGFTQNGIEIASPPTPRSRSGRPVSRAVRRECGLLRAR
jgi:hypothetical protein